MVKNYVCDECNKTFRSVDQMIKHISVHTDSDKEQSSNNVGQRYQCEHCRGEFTSESHLQTHIQCHHSQTIYLLSSNNERSEENDIKIKQETHISQENLSSDNLNTDTAENIYDTDIKVEESNWEGAIVIDDDDDDDLNNSNSVGEDSMRGKNTFNSGTKTSSVDRQENNDTTVHTEENRCHLCNKHFVQYYNLVVHMRTHTGEKPFKCHSCGKRCTTSSALKVHVRVHTGAKPYKCNECGSTFSTSSYLTIHERSHTGEKPHSCDVCGSSFVSSSKLNKHRKRHTREK